MTRNFTIQISGCFAELPGLPFLLTPNAFLTIMHPDIRANSYLQSTPLTNVRKVTVVSVLPRVTPEQRKAAYGRAPSGTASCSGARQPE